jgi:hypothetical protein
LLYFPQPSTVPSDFEGTMRGRLIYLCAVIGAYGATASAPPCAAELLAYDPFLIGDSPPDGEYILGTLAGQNPAIGPAVESFFEGPWFSGGPDQTGHAVRPVQPGEAASLIGGMVISTPHARTGRRLRSPWDHSTNGTFFLSYLTNFGTAVDDDNLGHRSTEFWAAGGALNNDASRVISIGYSQYGDLSLIPEQPDLLAWRVNHGAPQVLDHTPFNEDGRWHWIVLQFQLSDQPLSDTVSVYVDPQPGSAAPPTPNGRFAGIDFTLGIVGATSLFGGEGEFPAYDDLRVATSFADLAPPPDEPPECPPDWAYFLHMLEHFGQTGVSYCDGDANNDGRVDVRDYRLWRDHRIDVPASGAAGSAIPEPAGILLLVGALPLLGERRRRARGIFAA